MGLETEVPSASRWLRHSRPSAQHTPRRRLLCARPWARPRGADTGSICPVLGELPGLWGRLTRRGARAGGQNNASGEHRVLEGGGGGGGSGGGTVSPSLSLYSREYRGKTPWLLPEGPLQVSSVEINDFFAWMQKSSFFPKILYITKCGNSATSTPQHQPMAGVGRMHFPAFSPSLHHPRDAWGLLVLQADKTGSPGCTSSILTTALQGTVLRRSTPGN